MLKIKFFSNFHLAQFTYLPLYSQVCLIKDLVRWFRVHLFGYHKKGRCFYFITERRERRNTRRTERVGKVVDISSGRLSNKSVGCGLFTVILLFIGSMVKTTQREEGTLLNTLRYLYIVTKNDGVCSLPNFDPYLPTFFSSPRQSFPEKPCDPRRTQRSFSLGTCR